MIWTLNLKDTVVVNSYCVIVILRIPIVTLLYVPLLLYSFDTVVTAQYTVNRPLSQCSDTVVLILWHYCDICHTPASNDLCFGTFSLPCDRTVTSLSHPYNVLEVSHAIVPAVPLDCMECPKCPTHESITIVPSEFPGVLKSKYTSGSLSTAVPEQCRGSAEAVPK